MAKHGGWRGVAALLCALLLVLSACVADEARQEVTDEPEQAPLEAPAEQVEASLEVEAKEGEVPLVFVVAGFAGQDGQDALPYQADFDWNYTAFKGPESVSAYYRGQSDGAFSWVPAQESSTYDEKTNTCEADDENDGVVHVTLPRAHGHWFAPQDVAEPVPAAPAEDFSACVAQAVAAAADYVDFDSFDGDGDGVLAEDELEVVVVMAGYAQEGERMEALPEGAYPRIPTSSVTLEPVGADANQGVTLPAEVVVMAEKTVRMQAVQPDNTSEEKDLVTEQENSLSTLTQLLGTRLGIDSFAGVPADEAVPWTLWRPGLLSLMDQGTQGRATYEDGTYENVPASLDPLALANLGWASVEEVSLSGTYVVRSAGASGGKNLLMIPTNESDEYFLIENRQLVGQDRGLAELYGEGETGGIVVWHVDLSSEGAAGERPRLTVQYLMRTTPEGQDGIDTVALDEGIYPDLQSTFWDATRATERFESLGLDALELWQYGEGDPNDPADRQYLDVQIRFLDDSSDTMHVEIDLGDAEL